MFQSDRQGREVDKEDRSRRGDCSQLQRTGHSHKAGEVRCGIVWYIVGIGVGILVFLGIGSFVHWALSRGKRGWVSFPPGLRTLYVLDWVVSPGTWHILGIGIGIGILGCTLLLYCVGGSRPS